MFIYILAMALFVILVIITLCVMFLIKNKNKIDNNDQINRSKFNKQLKWMKKVFNGEEGEDCQLFFINKDDVTDVKLMYELLSAKKAVEQGNIREDYRSVSFDEQDKYCEYKITYDNKLKVNDDDVGYNFELYDAILDKKFEIEKLQERFKEESRFDEHDLVSYYKAIIESKKIDEDEVKKIAETYFKMVDELYRLKTLSRSETVNEAISKAHITKGFDQSQLKQELDELLK